MEDPRQFFADTPNAKIAAKIMDTAAMLASASSALHDALLTLRVNPTSPLVGQLLDGARRNISAAHTGHARDAFHLWDDFANGAVKDEEAKHGA